MKNIFEKIEHFITQKSLIEPGSTIIVGLSGGPDSVFLLHLLHALSQKLNLKVIAAHLDHEWRAESAQDIEFCHEICHELDIPLVYTSISELGAPLRFKGSKEEIGRKARRAFFEELAQEENADAIALAHHADDQQETFFIRLIRGSSLAGLTAMRPKEGLYIRPLLEIKKEEIVQYLQEHNIPYIEDPSNQLPTFLRNRIRKQVLPELRKADPRFDANFTKTLKRLKQTEAFLEKLTAETYKALKSTEDTGTTVLNLKNLLNLEPVMQDRILIYWLIQEQVPFVPTEKFLDEILRFLKQPGSKEHQIHHDWKLVKKKNMVFITKHEETNE